MLILSIQCDPNLTFTCSDGTCIDIHERCDTVYNCEDNSDELYCEPIAIDESTYKDHFPPTSPNSRMTIFVMLDIRSISQVDEANSQFMSEVAVHLKWKDPRITFKNLKENGNFFDSEWHSVMWLPPLMFSNSFGNVPLLQEDSLTVQVLKEGKPTIKSEKALNEGERYSGYENSLVLFGQYQNYFFCAFELTYFPFDTQHCSIEIRVPLNMRKYIRLEPMNLTFTGKYKVMVYNSA